MTTDGLTSLTAADVATVPAEVVDRIRAARDVLCVCHENPESDALGSALAVALAVEELGGRATPVCNDPVPQMFAFMPQIERFRQDPEPDHQYDLIVVGEVLRASFDPTLDPLLYFRGRYRRLHFD